MKLAELIRVCETFAAPDLALPKDRIGLQVGDPAATVTGVLLCVDVTRGAIAAARAKRCNVILAHHPLIYSPLTGLVPGTRQAELVAELARHRLALYVMHTNFDACAGGMNHLIAARLGLRDVRPLLPPREDYCKFVVFVPRSHGAAVLQAATAAGAGAYGDYDSCAYFGEGMGTFRPLDGAKPFIGKIGKTEAVAEVRIETRVQRRDLARVLAAVRKVHPYEEMAYDIYPLHSLGRGDGIGVQGRFPKALTLQDAARLIRRRCGAGAVQVVGKPGRRVSSVGIVGGGASDLIGDVFAAGVDIFVTGELKHSAFLEAEHQGLAVVAAGHHDTEKVFASGMAAVLRKSVSRKMKLVQYLGTAPYTSV